MIENPKSEVRVEAEEQMAKILAEVLQGRRYNLYFNPDARKLDMFEGLRGFCEEVGIDMIENENSPFGSVFFLDATLVNPFTETPYQSIRPMPSVIQYAGRHSGKSALLQFQRKFHEKLKQNDQIPN